MSEVKTNVESKDRTNAAYDKRNVKSSEQIVVPVNAEKKKVMLRRVFKNGVSKTELIGVIKNNKIIVNRGIDQKIIHDNSWR